jgi:hypothetical protein
MYVILIRVCNHNNRISLQIFFYVTKTLTANVLLEMHANVSVGSAQIKSASELNRELY